MKKGLSIFFLITFLFQSTGSLWIMLSFHVQRDYISKNICKNRLAESSSCKGKCYLNKQLEENEKQEQSIPDFKQKEMQLFTQTEVSAQSNTLLFIWANDNPFYEKFLFLSSEFLFSVFHPPRLA